MKRKILAVLMIIGWVFGAVCFAGAGSFTQGDWFGGVPTIGTCTAAGGTGDSETFACLAASSGYKGYSAIDTDITAGSTVCRQRGYIICGDVYDLDN